MTGNAYERESDLPLGLREALNLFDSAEALRDVLGAEFCKVYSAVKWTEQDEFVQIISPWEREHLLTNV